MDVHKYKSQLGVLETSIRGLADAVHDFESISTRFGRPVPPALVDCAVDLVDEIKAHLVRLKEDAG